METVLVSVHTHVDEKVAHTPDGILFSLEKEGDPALPDDKEEPGRRFAE